MLEIIEVENKYNVINTETNQLVLEKNYEHIELQDHGIVARENVKGTFLDHKYDLFDINGKFLFSKLEHYDGNYVTDYDFNIYKNYVRLHIQSTPDYDNYSHATDTWNEFYNLDGSYISIDNHGIYDIDDYGNHAVIEIDNGDRYVYDFKSKQVIFKESQLLNQVKPIIDEIEQVENENFKKLKKEHVIKEKYQAIKDNNLSAKDEIIFNKIVNKAIENNDFDFDKYYYDKNYKTIEDALFQVQEAHRRVKSARSETFLYEWGGFLTSGAKVLMRKMPVDDLEFESFWAGWSDLKNKCYIFLSLYRIDYKKLQINVHSNNVARLKNYYENVTGKKCYLALDDITIKKPENEERLELTK